MKKITSIIASVALLFGVSTAAQAQERDYTSASNFISVQAGAQTTFTDYQWYDLITPQYAISAGRYFNDKVGARLHVMGYQQKSGFEDTYFYRHFNEQTYKYKACTADLDLLMNMTNIILPNRLSHGFDWVLIAGFGVNYAWDFDEWKDVVATRPFYNGPMECGTKHSSFNGRLGTQFNWNVSDALTIGLELQANYKNDIYNLKHSDFVDWQVVGLVGVTYNFGYKKAKVVLPEPEPAPAPVVVEEPKPEPKPVVKEEPKPVVVEKPEILKEVIYYQIRESDPEADAILNHIVDWCNRYPQKSISIKGYADRGTGNPTLNKGYAEQRATKVADALRAKGIAADRMIVESFGDTVQPFEENDLNRCVIVVGE